VEADSKEMSQKVSATRWVGVRVTMVRIYDTPIIGEVYDESLSE